MAHAWDGMFISVYIPLGQIAPFSPPDNIPPHLGHCPCLLKRKCENRHQAVLLTLTDLSLSILYTLTVDRFMSCTVVEGGILHHVKWEGKLSGRGNVRGKVQGGCPDPVDYEPGQPKTRDERSEAAWAKQPSGGTAGGPHHIAALSIKLIKPPRRGNELYRYCTEPYVANT